MRFTVRFRIVDALWVTASASTLTLCSRATMSPPAKKMTHRRTALPAAATGTTSTSAATLAAAADNCCEVRVSDRATRRRHTCLVRPRSFLRYLCRQSRQYSVWAPAARFVALISRWWWPSTPCPDKNAHPKHVKITLWIEKDNHYFNLCHEKPSICNVCVKIHDK